MDNERDFSELTTQQLISIYANLGSHSSEFKKCVASEICNRLNDLDDEQFWQFVQLNKNVIIELNQLGQTLDYSRAYSQRQRKWCTKILLDFFKPIR
jgi:hypothetical protein